MNRFEDTIDFIDHLNRVDSAQGICTELIRITGQYGLDRLMAGTVPDPRAPENEQRKHVLLCGWPEEWLSRYASENYVEFDPIVGHVKKGLNPFIWDDAVGTIDKTHPGNKVMAEAAEFGLRSGVVIPLVTVDGTLAIVSLGGRNVDIPPYASGMISLVSTYAIARSIQLVAKTENSSASGLTKREAECIRWAAEGKSEWEISRILGISEHTSEKHLLNAKAKLGAANRVQAVAEAIRRGYIT